FLVDPLAARVADVGFETVIGGQPSAVDQVGLDERPRAVTDDTERFFGREEVVEEGHGVVVRTEGVRTDGPAGNHESVVLFDAGVRKRRLDLVGIARIEVAVNGLGLAGFGTEDLDAGSGLGHGVAWRGEFDFLAASLGENDADRLAVELLTHVFSHRDKARELRKSSACYYNARRSRTVSRHGTTHASGFRYSVSFGEPKTRTFLCFRQA